MLLRDQRLRVFHAVAVHQSFTTAGRVLCLTQQAISFQIRSLEQELKTTLFTRRHHSVELTMAGSVLFDHADKIMSGYDDATRALAALRNPPVSCLRVAATNTISKYVMPDAISQFRSKNPKIQIILEIGNSGRVIDFLNRRAVDLAITSDGAPSLSSYQVTPLFRDPIAFVVSRQHAWASKSALTIEDLLSTPVIMREEGSGTRALLERHLAARDLSLNMLKVALVVGSPEAVKETARAGIGVGILSRLCAHDDATARDLVLKHIVDFEIIRDFYVVRPLNDPTTPPVHEFMTILDKTAGYRQP